MHQAAVRHLKKADPVMARVVDVVGPCRFRPITDATHFHHLARAIVYQQLSTKAATTIFGRVLALCGTSLEPDSVLAQPDEALRSAGLSSQKTRYVKDLAAHVRDDRLPLDRLDQMDDREVIAALRQVKGIGVWSAQMFLIFRLGRPDVLPVLDLGIRKGVQRAYGLRRLPALRYVERIGKRWSPYSTIASWYLWRLLDQPAEP
jgi:DNA-3-methyladenine glycosylase II